MRVTNDRRRAYIYTVFLCAVDCSNGGGELVLNVKSENARCFVRGERGNKVSVYTRGTVKSGYDETRRRARRNSSTTDTDSPVTS